MNFSNIAIKKDMAITFLDYQGNAVAFDLNGRIMINATQMAKPFKKLVKDWLVLKQTQEFLKVLILSREENSPNVDYQILTDFSNIPGYVEIKQGGKPDEQGTWIHEDVAIEFARWLSPAFSIWCNDQIKLLLKQRYALTEEDIKKKVLSGDIRFTVPEITGRNGGRYRLMPSDYWKSDGLKWSRTNFYCNQQVLPVETAIDTKGNKWYNIGTILRLLGKDESYAAGFIRGTDFKHSRQFCPFNKGYKRYFVSEQIIKELGFGENNQVTITDTLYHRRMDIADFERKILSIIDQVKTLPEKEFLIDLYKLFK